MRNKYMNVKYFCFLIIVALTISSCDNKTDVSQYAPTEIFPNDTILQNIQTKRAMIVIAHDDDMCGMAGTISLLNKQGWEIAVVSFSQAPDRNSAQVLACRNILDTVMFVNLKPEQYRYDLDTVDNAYYAIPRNRFNDVFNRPAIEAE